MKRWLISLLALLLIGVPSVDAGDNIKVSSDQIESLFQDAMEEIVPEHDQPWHVTFVPVGNLWVFQFGGNDKEVHWDYGASILMEIARGRGHALWFGAAYRQAAGFGSAQKVTPFDPKQDDVAELFEWRYALNSRLRVFTWWERWCFHSIDRRDLWATYYTMTDLGLGTISPAEEVMPAIRARKQRKLQLDGYLHAGPILTGSKGTLEVLGNVPSWNAIGKSYGVAVLPVTRTFQAEVVFRFDVMLLSESQPNRWRQRSDLRIRFNLQRDQGSFSCFVGRHFRDQFPFRNSPVQNYIGMDYRF